MRNNREQEIYEEGFTAGKMESTKYWKPRVQALERAIKGDDTYCVNNNSGNSDGGHCCKCNDMVNTECWQFAYERFKEME